MIYAEKFCYEGRVISSYGLEIKNLQGCKISRNVEPMRENGFPWFFFQKKKIEIFRKNKQKTFNIG